MRRRCGSEPHLNAVYVRIKEAGAGKAPQITARFSEAGTGRVLQIITGRFSEAGTGKALQITAQFIEVGTGKALQITARFIEAGLDKTLQIITRFNKDIACRAPQTDCLVDTAADLC